jgi:hypothetical protein
VPDLPSSNAAPGARGALPPNLAQTTCSQLPSKREADRHTTTEAPARHQVHTVQEHQIEQM